VKTEDERH